MQCAVRATSNDPMPLSHNCRLTPTFAAWTCRLTCMTIMQTYVKQTFQLQCVDLNVLCLLRGTRLVFVCIWDEKKKKNPHRQPGRCMEAHPVFRTLSWWGLLDPIMLAHEHVGKPAAGSQRLQQLGQYASSPGHRD